MGRIGPALANAGLCDMAQVHIYVNGTFGTRYRAYARTAPGGRNQRELDVEHAWSRVVDAVVARDPDLVTIAGDVFHHPRRHARRDRVP